MRIAIAGAGIAGLTSAIALSRRGFQVEVFERAARLEDIGAGIQLSPNATALLERLGVMAALAGKTSEPGSLAIRDARSGGLLTRLLLGQDARARWGAPYITLHRVDLQAALLATARRQPTVAITLAAEVREVRSAEERVTFVAGGEARVADVLVAADGVRSAIRREVFNYPESASFGRSAWRAVIPASEAADHVLLDEIGLWLGAGGHLVHYPVAGGKAVNIVTIAKGDSAAPPVAPFKSQSLHLIRSISAWTATTLSYVDPAKNWTHGRIVLIGDAAHAMAPSAAQGGAQAIEDAYELAESFGHSTAYGSAFALYTKARAPRVTRVARLASRNLNAYEITGVPAIARNLVLRTSPAMLLGPKLDWLFGWKPK